MGEREREVVVRALPVANDVVEQLRAQLVKVWAGDVGAKQTLVLLTGQLKESPTRSNTWKSKHIPQ